MEETRQETREPEPGGEQIKCGVCGGHFDPSDLNAVLYHERDPHRPIAAVEYSGSRQVRLAVSERCRHLNAKPHTNPCPDCGATLYWPGEAGEPEQTECPACGAELRVHLDRGRIVGVIAPSTDEQGEAGEPEPGGERCRHEGTLVPFGTVVGCLRCREVWYPARPTPAVSEDVRDESLREWEPPPGPPSFKPRQCPNGHPLRWLTHSVATCGDGKANTGCGITQHWYESRSQRGQQLNRLTDPVALSLAWKLSRNLTILALLREKGATHGEE